MSASSYERIWAVVRRIPRGQVATYGQVARVAGLPRQARMVGYALNALPNVDAKRVSAAKRVPWQRVINAQGRISARAFAGSEAVQRKLLEREGVRFDARERVDLARFGWRGASEARCAAQPRVVRVARGPTLARGPMSRGGRAGSRRT